VPDIFRQLAGAGGENGLAEAGEESVQFGNDAALLGEGSCPDAQGL
jgi:hypothetical protein